MKKGLDQVIVALDVPNLTSAIAIMEKLPEVTFWKVGLELFISAGPQILEILKNQQKRIFLDLKLHDIPNTVAGACQSALIYQVDLLTIHLASGKEALIRAVEQVKGSPTKLLGITLLTSLNQEELVEELKVPLQVSDYVHHMTQLAQRSGFHGIVCSPIEVARLRQLCPPDFVLVCPGIRPQGSTSGDDQKRTTTPLEAFQAGADYLVIGRPLTRAADPEEAWNSLGRELAGQ